MLLKFYHNFDPITRHIFVQIRKDTPNDIY
jgi:hypothetical protein